MSALTVTADMTVADVLSQWPQTVPVFHRFQTACVGCALASFDTLADVARIYQLDLTAFVTAITAAALNQEAGSEVSTTTTFT